MKSVSVIVRVYNEIEYVDACVESIINQSYENLRIILLDDGSQDGSAELCDKWEKTDSRITTVHLPNVGPCEALNSGVRMADGDYVTFVDGDDVISRDLIKKLVDMSEKFGNCISVTAHSYDESEVDELSENVSDIVYEAKEAVIKLIEDEYLQSFVWAKLYPAGCIKNIVFPAENPYGDVFVMHKIFMNSERVIYSPLKMYYYRQREKSILRSRDLSLNISQYEAYLEQRKDVVGRWEELESMIDSRNYKFLISTYLYYQREYINVNKFELPMKKVLNDIKECKKRLKEHKMFSLKDEMYYFRIMISEKCK